MTEQYDYFLLGKYMPIRATVGIPGSASESAVYSEAFTPDQATGALKRNMEILHRIRVSDEIETIDARQFEQACAAIYSEKKSEARREPA
jgi:hypothetical protein